VEQTAEWVAAERKAALAHEYSQGLNEFFLELDEKLGIKPAGESEPKVPLDASTHDFGDGPVPAHQHSNGGGWVAETARVEETAYVGSGAAVFDRASVSHVAIISENAEVRDDAKVFGSAMVTGNARVSGQAKVCGDTLVFGNALVTDSATVYGDARVYGNTMVFGKADVGMGTRISGNAMICDPEREAEIRVAQVKAVPAALPGASLAPRWGIARG
jgi:UDP-3-O-[3-hydroxymyristoyl] glucosamine N-acyltransferase